MPGTVSPQTAPPQNVQLRILLPESVLNQYQQQAETSNVPLEELISRRLVAHAQYAAIKPLYFDDHDRQDLERLLGKNVSSTHDVLIQIRNAISVRIQNVRITLKPGLLSRLKTRCLGVGWEEFLEKTITDALERYVGMR